MKIAVLSRNFSASAGGAEHHAMALVNGLAPSHEIHVFSQFREHEDPRVNYRAVPQFLVRPRWINQLFFAAYTWWATRRGFDVAHSHGTMSHGSIQTVHVLPVWFNYFSGRRDPRRRALLPKALRNALRWAQVCAIPRLLTYLCLEHLRFRPQSGRFVVCVSQILRQVMAETFPAGEGSLRVIAPGLSAVAGRCLPNERAEARIKLELPIEERVGEALELVGKHQLGARVRVRGTFSTMELAYRAVDCLVHPTLEDTYAMVVLEAMSHGVPVIVSAAEFCGVVAKLNDGENAFTLNDPKYQSELRSAIDRIFGDVGLSERLTASGIDFARGRAWSEVVVSYENVFRDSVAAG